MSPRRIAISGASGLVGSALSRHLRARGDDVVHLVRRPPAAGSPTGIVETTWTPERGLAEPRDLEGIDALVHLAGESLATGRFGAAHRRRIRDSRVQGTRSLVAALLGLSRPPKVLLSASAAGYYGDRGAEPLDDQAPQGRGFLADVCAAWEQAARGAREARIRVTCCRFGMVLAAEGGALQRMLPLFRMGLGGRLGDGRQYWPWIAIDDVVQALEHLLARDDLEGAVNVVAPDSVTNANFTVTLGRVLGRLTWLAIPAPALRVAMGAGADELVLASARVVPARLQGSGFLFRYPELEGALRHLVARQAT